MSITATEKNGSRQRTKRTNLQTFQSQMIRPQERIRALNRYLQQSKILPKEVENLRFKYLGTDVLGDYVTIVNGHEKGIIIKIVPASYNPAKKIPETVIMQGNLEHAVLKLLKSIQKSTLELNAFLKNVKQINVPDLSHVIKALFGYVL